MQIFYLLPAIILMMMTHASIANEVARAIPEGFTVEKLYDVQKEEGSWVSMAVDDKGRIYCSDQGVSGIYRLTIDGKNVTKEKLKINISGAQGLLWAFDGLYACVSNIRKKKGNKTPTLPPGIYKIIDSDNDDELDEIIEISKFVPRAGGEHGNHGLVLSPDKKSIYVIAGNYTNVPDYKISRVITNYKEDQLLPSMPDARGHAKNIDAPGGWIAKTDPEGKNWTLIATGFRNQYDAAFNVDGELFTYDADMEWDVGTPWYRPTRIYHCTSGAQFGWRKGTGKFPVWYPDVLPPALDVGPGSPTGVVSGEEANFPNKYRNAIFAFDWTYGIIYAIHLKPNGSSYLAEKERFVTGIPLNVADGVIGKDGAMYFVTGGRGTPSAVYRVSYVGNESTKFVRKTDPKAAELRALRHSIEKYHGINEPNAVDELWQYLDHDDRFIRYAARVAVEHQEISLWQSKALNETNAKKSLSALLALAKQGGKKVQKPLIDALLNLGFSELPEDLKQEKLRVYSLCFIRMGEPSAEIANKIVAEINPLYPSSSDALNRDLVSMLVYLKSDDVIAKTVRLLNQESVATKEENIDEDLLKRSKKYGGAFLNKKSSKGQQQQIHYVYALKNVKDGWTLSERQQLFTWFAKAKNYKGGSSFSGFIKNFRNDALAMIEDPTLKKEMDVLSSAAKNLIPNGFGDAEKMTLICNEGMQYDKSHLEVKAGAKVALRFVNNDPLGLVHNVAFVERGSMEKVVSAAVALGAKGIEMEWVPEISEVIAATPQIGPKQQFTLYFKAPEVPGDYPFVCTYPGHSIKMNGILRVN